MCNSPTGHKGNLRANQCKLSGYSEGFLLFMLGLQQHGYRSIA